MLSLSFLPSCFCVNFFMPLKDKDAPKLYFEHFASPTRPAAFILQHVPIPRWMEWVISCRRSMGSRTNTTARNQRYASGDILLTRITRDFLLSFLPSVSFLFCLQVADDEISDNSAECVVCLSDVRDTLILPCRHLCLCNACADTLRYQANCCPICRLREFPLTTKIFSPKRDAESCLRGLFAICILRRCSTEAQKYRKSWGSGNLPQWPTDLSPLTNHCSRGNMVWNLTSGKSRCK